MSLVSCGKTVDLSGYAWTASVVTHDDGGVYTPFSFTLLCNGENSGVAFFTETYPGDPIPYGFSMPFVYTWDGEDGTLTLDDGMAGIVVPLEYERAERNSVVADISGMRDYYPKYAYAYSLKQKGYYSPASVAGTHWEFAYEYTDIIDDTKAEVTVHCRYELDFMEMNAVLHHCVIAADGSCDTTTWQIPEYTYANGFGRMTIAGFLPNFEFVGHFYLPDERHLGFFDGESVLPMRR